MWYIVLEHTIVTIAGVVIPYSSEPSCSIHSYYDVGASQVSHYPGETAIRIDFNQLGVYSYTNPGLPATIALGHL